MVVTISFIIVELQNSVVLHCLVVRQNESTFLGFTARVLV